MSNMTVITVPYGQVFTLKNDIEQSELIKVELHLSIFGQRIITSGFIHYDEPGEVYAIDAGFGVDFDDEVVIPE